MLLEGTCHIHLGSRLKASGEATLQSLFNRIGIN